MHYCGKTSLSKKLLMFTINLIAAVEIQSVSISGFFPCSFDRSRLSEFIPYKAYTNKSNSRTSYWCFNAIFIISYRCFNTMLQGNGIVLYGDRGGRGENKYFHREICRDQSHRF